MTDDNFPAMPGGTASDEPTTLDRLTALWNDLGPADRKTFLSEVAGVRPVAPKRKPRRRAARKRPATSKNAAPAAPVKDAAQAEVEPKTEKDKKKKKKEKKDKKKDRKKNKNKKKK